jgi:hypothetical protein
METNRKSARHTAARKAANKSSGKTKSSTQRRYSPEASEYVEAEMKEMKEGKLKSGGSGKKVTNPKQAIAIGLSEARKAGEKVPPPRRRAA